MKQTPEEEAWAKAVVKRDAATFRRLLAPGKPFEHRYRFTDTWVKRGTQWQIVAAQDYLVPAGRR